MHLELHLGLLKRLSFIVVLRLLLQNAVSLVGEASRCLPDLRRPLLELLLVCLEEETFLVKAFPVSGKQFAFLLKESPLFSELAFSMRNGLPPFLNLDGCNLQVSKLSVAEVNFIVLSLFLQPAFEVLKLLLLVLQIEVGDLLLGTPPLGLTLEPLLLKRHELPGLPLTDSLLLQVDFILLAYLLLLNA